MSHNKRHQTCNSSSSSSGSGSGPFPAMKKAKSQLTPFSVEKNCLQQPQNHLTGVDDDPDSMLIAGDLHPNAVAAAAASDAPSITFGMVACSGNPLGVAANLSRKKATPPQPAKKLVIKLVKEKEEEEKLNCQEGRGFRTLIYPSY